MPKLLNLFNRFVSWLEEPEAAPTQPPPPEPTFLERFAQQTAAKGEKRASSRQTFQINAELSDSIKGVRSNITVENLSSQGIYLTAGYALVVGSVVEISLELPKGLDGESRQVTFMGRITRVDHKPGEQFGIAALIIRCRNAAPPSPSGS